jgi:membrane protease YdiL (CAAX protease family)
MTWNPGVPLPPPQPLSYALPPTLRENRLVILLCWVVIIGVVVFVGIENWRSSHDAKMEVAASGIEMEITARTVVGYVTLVRKAGVATQLEQKVPEMVASATSAADGPKQKLQAVAVIGELQGKEAALDRLAALKEELKAPEPELKHDLDTLRRIYHKSPTAVSEEDRIRLESRLGWFGKLALVSGLPDSDPQRESILRACIRAAVAAVSIELLLVGFLIAGLVLMIIAIVKLAGGTLKLNYIPSPGVGSAFIETFALYLVGYVSIGRIAHALHLHAALPVYGIIILWITACCLWPMVRGLSFAQIRAGLGWSTGRGVIFEAAMGLVGYLTFMPLLAIAVITTMILSRFGHEHAIHPIVFEAEDHSKSAIIGLFLLASGFAPIVEETMFRGAMFHHLRRRHRWLLSAFVSALIFASLHPQGWTAFPVLGGIGFAFAGIREWRGNVIASGFAHAVNNGVALTMLLLVLG